MEFSEHCAYVTELLRNEVILRYADKVITREERDIAFHNLDHGLWLAQSRVIRRVGPNSYRIPSSDQPGLYYEVHPASIAEEACSCRSRKVTVLTFVLKGTPFQTYGCKHCMAAIIWSLATERSEASRGRKDESIDATIQLLYGDGNEEL